MFIAVIDYGAGNLRSVLRALNQLDLNLNTSVSVRVVQHPNDLAGADKIILPGVGAFSAGMQHLHQRQLVPAIQAAVQRGTPYLGICLGMQLLFESSTEATADAHTQHTAGLGILQGSVQRIPADSGVKVPHVGWNQLQITRETPLFSAVSNQSYVYFVHSYYCVPAQPADTVATVDYGTTFTVAVQREHVFGVQFHPEKSHPIGTQILKNFLTL